MGKLGAFSLSRTRLPFKQVSARKLVLNFPDNIPRRERQVPGYFMPPFVISCSSVQPRLHQLLSFAPIDMWKTLDLKFCDVEPASTFEYNFKHVIDNFIILTVFVGNDFLSNLPDLHIHENELERLLDVYKKILSSLCRSFRPMLRWIRPFMCLCCRWLFEREQNDRYSTVAGCSQWDGEIEATWIGIKGEQLKKWNQVEVFKARYVPSFPADIFTISPHPINSE